MSTFVLVHGAWGGAWIWRRVLDPLRAAGHEVHAVTLTGDGERAHLRRPDIDLKVHIDDVLGLIDAEELGDIVLVGHSYGGMVITGVADALGPSIRRKAYPVLSLSKDQGERVRSSVRAEVSKPARVKQLVYIDAMVPVPGEGWGSGHPPEIVAARQALAAAHDNALPPPDPRDFGIADGPDRDWLLRRQVPHPFGMYRVPLAFDGARWAQVPRLFIDCNRPAYVTIDAMRVRVRQQPGWRIVELPTGHCPMVTMPAELAAHLLSVA